MLINNFNIQVYIVYLDFKLINKIDYEWNIEIHNFKERRRCLNEPDVIECKLNSPPVPFDCQIQRLEVEYRKNELLIT